MLFGVIVLFLKLGHSNTLCNDMGYNTGYYTKAHIHLPLLDVVPGLSITLEIFHLCNNKERRSRVGLLISEFRSVRIRLSQLLIIT